MENISGCWTMPCTTSRCVSGSMSGAVVVALEDHPVRGQDARLVLQRPHAPVRQVLPVRQDVGPAARNLPSNFEGVPYEVGGMGRPGCCAVDGIGSCAPPAR